MYHYFEALTNTSGDSLVGYFARVVDRATQAAITLYSDEAGTPISTISGYPNLAKTDDYGNLDFYLAPGTYHLDIYAPDAVTFRFRVNNVGMTSVQGEQGDKGDTGDPGPAMATYTTLAAFKAADITNKSQFLQDPAITFGPFYWETANAPYTADNVNVIKADSTALSVGAWVRQKADGVLDTARYQSVQRSLDDLYYGASDLASLEALVTDIANGVARSVDAEGDSTCFGADANNGLNQVATPSPLQMQNFVNTFLGVSALTVNNNGLSGTTLTQLINGTGAYTQPLAVRLASSSATMVKTNHGINDAEGPNATTPAQYEAALEAFVLTVRRAGKIPGFETPFPCLNYPLAPTGFGSAARAQKTARFAQIMRDVANRMNVPLVDQFALFRARFDQGVSPVTTLPDGVHGTESSNHGAYIFAGNNGAMFLLGAHAVTFDGPGRVAGLSASFHRVSNEQIYQAPTARTGVVVGSTQASNNTMRLVFYVPPGAAEQDLSIEQMCYAAGDSAIAVSIDGFARNNIRQYRPGWTTIFEFNEAYIARRIGAGFHLLYMRTTNGGAVNLSTLRSRPASSPLQFYGSPDRVDVELSSQLAIVGAGVTIFDQFLMDWREDDCEFEFKAKFNGNTGFVLGGYAGTLNSGANAVQHIIIGVSGTDLTVWEADAQSSSFTSATIDSSINYTSAEHTYRVKISSAGAISVAVDGAAPFGTTFTLTHGYQSGLVGLWQFSGSTEFSVRDVKQIWYSPNIPLLPI